MLKNQLFFVENRLSEDVVFTAQIMMQDPKIYFSTKAFYYYRAYREGALTTTNSIKRINDTLMMIDYTAELIKSREKYTFFIDQLCYEYLYLMLCIPLVEKNIKVESINLFKEFLSLLNLSNKIFINIMKYFINIFGVSITAYILFYVNKLRKIYIKIKENNFNE